MAITVTVEDKDGYETEVKLPTTRIVCPRCRGTGVHDHPAFCNGFTSDEMQELGQDFQEDYMSGVYDVTCEDCNGANVVEVVDTERLKPEHRDAWQSHCEYQNELAMEKRMRAQGIQF